MNSITAQLLREIAERIILRCTAPLSCADCRRDAEDLRRIAVQFQARVGSE